MVGGFASAVFEKTFIVALPWVAPELVISPTTDITTASDVYSFAMTVLTVGIRSVLEVFSSLDD